MNFKQGWPLMLGMMTRPRQTMTQIAAHQQFEWVLPLAALFGAIDALLRISDKHLDTSMSPAILVVIAVFSGGLWGLIGLYLYGWLMFVSGRWIGGRASVEALRAALVWGRMPVLLVGAIFIIEWLIGGWRVFGDEASLYEDPVLRWPMLALSIGMLIFIVWQIVTIVAAVSAVQGFGLLKAIGNLLLACLLILVPLLLVIGGIYYVAH